ncbi:MAG: glycoside-pentoside-hexuronide (GPH):cation symporter [Clostridiales bacterium]|jgi:probable glucitol transport protein GutA|nr:glycoside-pentoside-hexuronide (GPH):cation symporter [Clostridiales bacterium]
MQKLKKAAPPPTEVAHHVGTWEKTTYGLYFWGQNIFYALVGLNVQTLFSDVGITAAVVALIVLFTKIWDAVNDALFGVIIDKIRFKKGRYMPWIRLSLAPIAVFSLFLFALPANIPIGLKVLWAVIGYVAWDMSYTLCDVPIYVLPMSMTANVQERNGILSFGRYLGVVGILLGSIMLPMVQARLGWFGIAVVFTVLAVISMLPICFAAKERNIVRPEAAVTFKQMFRYISKNKFLLIFYAAMFITGATNFASVLQLFFARYNLGNQDVASMLGLVSMVPMILVGAFVPAIIKKIDKFCLYFGVCAFNCLLGIVRYFMGYENFTLFLVFTILSAIAGAANGILVFLFTPDCIEYGTYHTGERAEGVATAIQSFFNKLTSSVSASLAMLIIGLFGFVAGENAVQPQSALEGIWLSLTLFPSIGAAISVAALWFYKLRDKDVQVMARYNSGEISKEEAERVLSKRYGSAAALGKMTVTHD